MLQSLTFEIDWHSVNVLETPHEKNKRIIQMTESRLQPGLEIKLELVRMMYMSYGFKVLKDVFPDPWASGPTHPLLTRLSWNRWKST